jgi:hypothetical protein
MIKRPNMICTFFVKEGYFIIGFTLNSTIIMPAIGGHCKVKRKRLPFWDSLLIIDNLLD